jgi:hypothetical protein
MTTLLFVHGTGVRAAGSGASLGTIKKALGPLRPDVEVQHCDWGDDFGTKLFGGGLSIPNYTTARGPGAEDAEAEGDEHVAALWTLLEDDPLFELRLLAQRQPAGELAPNQKPPGEALRKRLGDLASLAALPAEQSRLAQAVDAAGLAPHYHPACTDVLNAAAFTEAIGTASMGPDEDRAAIGRAVIAQALVRAEADDTPPAAAFDPELRDEAAEALATALGASSRSVVGRCIRAPFIAVGKRMATRYLRRKRGKVTDAVFGAPGDILLYQARGQAIRDRIAAKVEEVRPKGPVVLLAHSLGGIACVDLLVGRNPGVALLITVGSQAPYLYEMNALVSLPYDGQVPADGRLPAHFPDWLNVYDLRDMLSYIGRGLLGKKVEDIEVDNGKPFPNSHSAYWDNRKFWEIIAPRLP